MQTIRQEAGEVGMFSPLFEMGNNAYLCWNHFWLVISFILSAHGRHGECPAAPPSAFLPRLRLLCPSFIAIVRDVFIMWRLGSALAGAKTQRKRDWPRRRNYASYLTNILSVIRTPSSHPPVPCGLFPGLGRNCDGASITRPCARPSHA